MNVFFDTSVLVAASEQSHPHYNRAHPAVVRVASGRDKGFISIHSLAEVFATLTRLPVQPRIHPLEAERIIATNILPYFELVSPARSDYIHSINTMAAGGRAGAQVYDALILSCAALCNPDRIYTFNLSDFRQLAPTTLRAKICSP